MSGKIHHPTFIPKPSWLSNQEKWINEQTSQMSNQLLDQLVRQAVAAQKISYSPYSHYHVGAAVLTLSGKIYTGTNIERASYSETIHSEESAIAAAILDGEINRSGRRFLKALAVAHISDTAPCGHCRQIMAEHCDNCLVIVADKQGKVRNLTSLAILLPYAFNPTDLGII